MTKEKLYRYLGRNGILTTKVFIEDAKHIVLYSLTADEGKVLTDGTRTTDNVLVYEDELSNWKEIADKTK